MKYTIAKGLFDILPYQIDQDWRYSFYYQHVESIIHQIASNYNYKEFRTPIFEKTELFQRGVGTSSDIVTKEMYTFEDRAKRLVSLRPEGTASLMRAFIEKNLESLRKVHKFFYIAPMFRYERPQSGRYRQHHQFGVEAIGNGSVEQDAEVIDLLLTFYKTLGLKDLNLMINTVGDSESREAFKKALLDYLKPNFDQLSEHSKVRFEKNPLRILDSKSAQDQEIIKNAPSLLEYLNDTSKKEFEDLKSLLQDLNIEYTVNDKLVRGLDYYNKTVFEVTAEALGAQNAIGAGGRYDGLIKQFNGPDLPSIGFGTGLERIIQTMMGQNISFPEEKGPLFYFSSLDNQASHTCFKWAQHLRHENISCEIDLKSKKPKQALQQATLNKASYVILIGSEELEKKQAAVKNLETREQIDIPFENLIDKLKTLANDGKL